MPRFSRRSLDHLETCHKDIQLVCKALIEIIDFSVVEGHRGAELQNKYFEEGKSKLPFPLSAHNIYPSQAVHLLPHPFPGWSRHKDLIYFGGLVVGYALRLGVTLRFGGDWDGDRRVEDETFLDLTHFEMTRESVQKACHPAHRSGVQKQ